MSKKNCILIIKGFASARMERSKFFWAVKYSTPWILGVVSNVMDLPILPLYCLGFLLYDINYGLLDCKIPAQDLVVKFADNVYNLMITNSFYEARKRISGSIPPLD